MKLEDSVCDAGFVVSVFVKRFTEEDMTFNMNNVPRVSIFRARDMGKRIWGQELLLGIMPQEFAVGGAAFKLIQMNAGFSGRFQMHFKRHEYGYVLDGCMQLKVGLSDGKVEEYLLEPGDAYHFPPGLPHQEEAIVFTRVIELSPALGNDRMGLEHEYGLPPPLTGSLPDSTEESITFLKPWWKDGVIYKE